MDLFEDLKLWAGTEESLAAYLLQLRKLAMDSSLTDMLAEGRSPRQRAAGMVLGQDKAAVEEMPRLLKVADGVATIRIAGSLNNSASWINQYIGATGYPEIREALVYAAKDPEINAIVLDIASGGGLVSGCADCGELIATIDAKVKPVHSFSDSAMMSAAYWLGSSARSITISKTAEAGSVGVLIVHQELTKMMEKVGITPTVVRAGKYKALGNPYEPLSEAGRDELQRSVDHSYGIFVQHVADSRKVSYQVADTKMAQGRIFPGTLAVEAGLVDAVGNFDSVISKAMKAKPKANITGGIASAKSNTQYGANSTQGHEVKTALTEQQLAAMAEGVGLADEAAAAAAAEQAAAAAAAAGAGEKDEGADEAAAAAAATAAAEAQAAATAAAAQVASDNAVITYLQGQLAGAQAQVTNLSAEAATTKAALEGMQANFTAMQAIAAVSVDNMRVALGHPAGAAASMTAAELLAAHGMLREQFKEKFKAGGVAAVSAAAAADKKGQVAVDPLRMARIQATRLN